MPYVVEEDTAACSAAKPWAVKTKGGADAGRVHGCHPTKEHAQRQQRALYASVPDAKSAAPEPPNLRDAEAGSDRRCETCQMYDDSEGICWGYGNRDVRPDQLCDSYALEPSEAKASTNRGTLEVARMEKTYEPADIRAKYSSKELDSMVEKGHAIKNDAGEASYPIADTSDLKKAIRAVGRGGADHDVIRKHIIARAKALGHSDLIPDNWTSSGALSETKGVWETDEQRETYSDLCTALQDCCSDLVGDGWYCWIQDFDDARVYFQVGGTLYGADYQVEDGGPVTLGDPERVRPVTSYVPAEGERSGDWLGWHERRKADAPEPPEEQPAEPRKQQRLATRTLEWRKERATSVGTLAREERHIVSPIELREDEDQDTITVGSYASVFGSPYMVGSEGFRYEETVKTGAFKRTLANGPDVVFRTEHSSLPLARTSSGTLRLIEDETGLRYEADLDRSDPDVQALLPKLRRGDLSESSFAFRCTQDEWSEDYSRRALMACELHRGDVSVVTFGASPITSQYMTLRAEDEEALRALRADGLEPFLAAWVEWRDYTLLPEEDRAGKALSAATMSTLSHVLSLVAAADKAVDAAQPVLADLMGVPNPDEDEDGEGSSPAAQEGDEETGNEGDGRGADDFWEELRALAERCHWRVEDRDGGVYFLQRSEPETAKEPGKLLDMRAARRTLRGDR